MGEGGYVRAEDRHISSVRLGSELHSGMKFCVCSCFLHITHEYIHRQPPLTSRSDNTLTAITLFITARCVLLALGRRGLEDFDLAISHRLRLWTAILARKVRYLLLRPVNSVCHSGRSSQAPSKVCATQGDPHTPRQRCVSLKEILTRPVNSVRHSRGSSRQK